MIRIKIPEEVIKIIKIFKENGFKAYITGGCVRDLIMGKQPNDYDISTSATPDEVKMIFDKTYDTGIKHGTVTVILNKVEYEVTTFRIEDKYIDNRRPEKIKYTKCIEDDLKRRDFTINAMAADSQGNIIDLYNGIKHIKEKKIKCVGNPEKRFTEDALRMLRAVRFSCQLNFEIDKNTKDALKKLNILINNISYERIKKEFDLIIISRNISKGIKILKDTGILDIILPELSSSIGVVQKNPYHIYDVGEHIIKAVENIENDLILKWTMLLHDIGKPISKTTDLEGIDHFFGHSQESLNISKRILNRYKFDNKSKDKILKLIEYHDVDLYIDAIPIKKMASIIGKDLFLDLLKVKKADIYAKNPQIYEKIVKHLDKVKSKYLKILSNEECMSIDCLNISGKDLINIGYKQGVEIGITLQKLLDIVINSPDKNKKELLIKEALQLKK